MTTIIALLVGIFCLACVVADVSERIPYGLALIMLAAASTTFFFNDEVAAIRLAGFGFDLLLGGAIVELARPRVSRFVGPVRTRMELRLSGWRSGPRVESSRRPEPAVDRSREYEPKHATSTRRRKRRRVMTESTWLTHGLAIVALSVGAPIAVRLQGPAALVPVAALFIAAFGAARSLTTPVLTVGAVAVVASIVALLAHDRDVWTLTFGLAVMAAALTCLRPMVERLPASRGVALVIAVVSTAGIVAFSIAR